MKVFLLELCRIDGDLNTARLQVLAIADDEDQARAHVLPRFTGWSVERSSEVEQRPVHFVLGELE